MTRELGTNDTIRTRRASCKVCQLGYSMLGNVNKLILQGVSYTQITTQLADFHEQGLIPYAPRYESVRNHAIKHVALETKIIRADMERRANEMNIDIENGVQTAVNFRTTVDTVMRKGFELIVTGKLKPGVKETLEAAKLVAQFEKDAEGQSSIVDLIAQVQRFRQAVVDIVPEQYHQLITDRVLELERRALDYSRGEVIESYAYDDEEEDND